MVVRMAGRVFDIAVTLICWSYFIFGFLLFFSPFYIAVLISSQSERVFSD